MRAFYEHSLHIYFAIYGDGMWLIKNKKYGNNISVTVEHLSKQSPFLRLCSLYVENVKHWYQEEMEKFNNFWQLFYIRSEEE